jgi:hypothetical protein
MIKNKPYIFYAINGVFKITIRNITFKIRRNI